MGKAKTYMGSTESLHFADNGSTASNGSEEEEPPCPEAIKKRAQSKATVQLRVIFILRMSLKHFITKKSPLLIIINALGKGHEKETNDSSKDQNQIC